MRAEGMEARHEPVMVREALELLAPSPGKVIVDCTVGAGGHARALIQKLLPGGKLIALDCNDKMLELARKNLSEFGEQVCFFQANFADLSVVLSQAGQEEVDGVIFDLGVASDELDDPTLGLSFQVDGPLDMRLSRSVRLTAYEVVNTFSEAKLAEIFWELGEERHARRIARRIVQERAKGPIRSTTQLANIIYDAVGGRREKIHPATRCFLALRLFVNDELEVLKRGLNAVPTHLRPGGRVVVISFHSLEDRIVKNTYKEWEKQGVVQILTRKVMRPCAEEVARNPRSRSAKMRAAERMPAVEI